MKNAAKISVGTIVLLYGFYGYISGEIFRLPSRRSNQDLQDLLISGDGLSLCVLSYAAFAFVFYVWAFSINEEYKATKRKMLRKRKKTSMLVLAILGITFQALSAFAE
jgi:amino acid permease